MTARPGLVRSMRAGEGIRIEVAGVAGYIELASIRGNHVRIRFDFPQDVVLSRIRNPAEGRPEEPGRVP